MDDPFASAAQFYVHRPAYSADAIQWLVERLKLDGRGRLLDVGCGTGHVCLRLAGEFAASIGIDPSRAMLDVARGIAASHGIEGIDFRQLRAEDLPADLGSFRLVTFGASFHRTDRPRVANIVHTMLEPGGALALLFPSTPWRVDAPWAAELRAVVQEYTERSIGGPFEPSQEVIRRSKFGSWEERDFRQQHVWTAAEIVGFMKSTSVCSSQALGARAGDFERELSARLLAAQPDDQFEDVIETTVVIAIKD